MDKWLGEGACEPYVTPEPTHISHWVYSNVHRLIFLLFSESEGECPLHLIILCHGHIWTMYPWDAEGTVS